MLKSLIRRDFVARGLTAVPAVTPIVAAASFRDIQCVGIGAAVAPGAPSAVVRRCAVSILVFFAHKGIRSRSHNLISGFGRLVSGISFKVSEVQISVGFVLLVELVILTRTQ